jgi:hypothetical protein
MAKGFSPRKCGLLRERTTYFYVEAADNVALRQKIRLKTNI